MITNLLILLAILTILTCLAIRERRKSIGKLYWHIHHDKLLEVATEPIARRKRFIRAAKLSGEVKTRLRCLKPVKGTLPDEIIEAFEVQAAAESRFHKASTGPEFCLWVGSKLYVDYYTANKDLKDTLQKYELEINRLHDEECSCPWNGTTLFPGG